MSLVKYPRCEGTELKVCTMLSLILVAGGFAVWFLVWNFEESSKEAELDKYLRDQLAYNGIDVSHVKEKITHNTFKLLMKGNGK